MHKISYELTDLLEMTDKPFSPELTAQMHTEIARLKNCFRRVIPGRDAAILQPYFRQVYNDLRDQLNTLNCVAEDHWAMVLLCRLMDELENSYYSYLDEEQTMPVYQARRLKEAGAGFFEQWVALLPAAGVDEALIKVIGQVVQLHKLDMGRITLGKCRYLNALMGELMHWVEGLDTNTGNDSLTDDLIQLLCLHNFNAAEFYLYCLERIDQQVDKNTYANEQLAQYGAQLDKVIRRPIMRREAYEPRLPPIDEQLAKGLHSAMAYVEYLDGLEKELLAAQHAEDFFRQDLSAPQIALYHALKIETGWYLDVKPGQLFRFIVRHFGSKEKGRMTYETYRANAYKRSSNDLKALRGKLMRVVEVIDSMS